MELEPSWMSLINTTAISVATVLGTGILGLPVSLHETGLGPFLILFSVTLIAQIGVVIAMTEVLQRAYYISSKQQASLPMGMQLSTAGYYQPLPLSEGEQMDEGYASSNHSECPSLHTLSKLFLKHWSTRLFFEGFVLLHFVSIMSSYALAAPQAYRQLIPMFNAVNHTFTTGAFTVTATLLVIFLVPLVLPALTFATILKGGLLSVLIAVTIYVGFEIQQTSTSAWGLSVIEPFLIGIIALSGVVNLMPVTFQTCIDSCKSTTSGMLSKSLIVKYRRATILGVMLCYLLNIGWCIGVLLCVPQTASSAKAATTIGHSFSRLHATPRVYDVLLRLATSSVNNKTKHIVSLAEAHDEGVISTVPLIEVLQGLEGRINQIVAVLLNVFIAISLTVSFFVMGIGMKHTLDGQLTGSWAQRSTVSGQHGIKAAYYSFWFGSVLLIALFKPHGFISLLAGVTSLSLNVEAGIFVMYMFYVSRRRSPTEPIVPCVLANWQATILVIAVGAFFSSAVLIDTILYIPGAFGW